MTVTEVLNQAMVLSPQERKRLAILLLETLDVSQQPQADEPEEHWGKSLNRLLDEIGPIELVDSHIEDPVEWVKVQREKERKKRLGDWGE